MKFALVFPGQGSQSVGMMKGYADLPIVQETFSEASDILHEDFWAMVNNGPSDSLNLHSKYIAGILLVLFYRDPDVPSDICESSCWI